MRFFILLLAIFFSTILPASSAVFIDSYRWSGSSVGISNTHNAVNTTAQTTYTYNSVPFGADDTNRQLVVAFWLYSGTLGAPTSVTIDGNAASLVTSAVPQANLGVYIYKVSDSTGSSGTVSISYASAGSSSAISVYRVVNASTTVHATATDTTISSDALSNSLSIPARGAAIACVQSITSGTWSASWTNITEDYDVQGSGTTIGFSSASKSVTTAETPTITATLQATATFGGLAMVSFSPL